MFKTITFAVLGITLLASGCADMRVRKITTCDRVTGKEYKIKGFRYYLSRPYIIVKKPIAVSESVKLKAIQNDEATARIFGHQLPQVGELPSPKPPATEPVAPKASLHSYSDQQLAMLTAGYPATIAMHHDKAKGATKIPESEWATMRDAIARDANIKQVTHGQPATTTNPVVVNVPTTPPPLVLGQGNQGSFVQTPVGLTQSNLMETPAEGGAAAGSTGPLENAKGTPADSTPLPPGDIQVVFLPDMEEEYAVHNRNWLAKSTYDLQFKDGWQLTSVNGDFDSTTVALELLKLVDTAVNQAKKVAAAGISGGTSAAVQGAAGTMSFVPFDATRTQQSLPMIEVRNTTYIAPGMYRINKPWEIESGVQGCGFLHKMGLETITVTTHRLAVAEHMLEPKPQPDFK